MCKRNILTIVAVAILALSASAGAADVTIDNPGFEDPVLADDDWSYSMDDQGWGYFNNDGYQGSWNITTADFPGEAPEGENIGWAEGEGMYGGFAQVLTDPDAVLKAGWTYTLAVEVGWGLTTDPFGGYTVQLLAGGTPHTPGDGTNYTGPVTGGTLLAEDDNLLTIAQGTFETSTVTYTYDPAHSGLLGEPLQIRLLAYAASDEVEFDDVTLTATESAPELASNPNPFDKATEVCPKVVLSWTPGAFVGALSPRHKVFLSENFDDVNDGNDVAKVAEQDPNYYPLSGTLSLDFGKTYYWKVDEANSTTGWDEGGVWQFTTEPFAYQLSGDEITASASSSMAADQGPENTINGSGLDANDLHSTVPTDMWLSGEELPPAQAWIEYEFDKVYKLHEMWVWNHNSGMEDDLGYGLKDVTIEYSENGDDYTTLGTTHEFAQAPGKANYEHNTEVYFGVPAKYVKITANSNWGGFYYKYGLSEVRFFRIPVFAGEESPESGTTIDGIDVVLRWRAGREAAEHNVYFSTSFEEVNTGTIAPDIIDAGGECRTTYGPLSLELGKTYYWKVNEVNDLEEPSTWEGDVWNFTTPEYLVVDDMEAYTGRKSIRYVWHDGYVPGIAPSGSNVTVSTESDDRDPRLAGVDPPWPVRGSEAMQFAYDNDGSITLYVQPYAITSYGANANYYSEIAASTSGPNSLEVGWDWTSAEALSLWFYGEPNNAAEEMYVKLNGSKVIYDGDAGDIQQAGWHEWNIALSDFGVNLQNVTMVYIGFGDENNTTPGGSGVVFFDDIRLYPTRCVLSKRSDDFARVDYVQDCVIDYKEVEVMAANWLEYASADGTLMNFPSDNSQWVGGKKNNALQFDGTDDYVDIGYSPELSLNEFTVSAWVNISAEPGLFGVLGTRVGGDTTFDFKVRATDVHGDIGDGSAWIDTAIDIGSTDTGTTGQGGDLAVDTWYVITYVIDNTNQQVRLYLDGDLKRTIAISGTPLLMKAGQRMRIGHTGTGSERMNGLIDDVRIYDYALSNTEVANIANEIGDPVPGPLLWYKLDETSGDIAKESVGTVIFYGPLPEPIDLYRDGTVDFKDFAELAAWWLEEVLLWP